MGLKVRQEETQQVSVSDEGYIHTGRSALHRTLVSHNPVENLWLFKAFITYKTTKMCLSKVSFVKGGHNRSSPSAGLRGYHDLNLP